MNLRESIRRSLIIQEAVKHDLYHGTSSLSPCLGFRNVV